ncbi:MAG: DedA family protein [Candidatus Omnitrophica bacterium]|nr:DedA family protein [Candidatus Omnitrophota bacterium]
MEILKHFLDVFLHIDKYLGAVIHDCGVWSYAVLFFIIFAETGLVVTPFLPGDSLLFAAGAFAGMGALHPAGLFLLLFTAAVLGNTVNYAAGHFLGAKAFQKYPGIFKKEYLDKTHYFYEKYGGKAIVIARFVPVARTFAPFIAGVGKMGYGRYLIYNAAGSLLWVALFVLGGYFFGNMPMIKKNFSLTVLVIICLSILPAVIEFWKHRRQNG